MDVLKRSRSALLDAHADANSWVTRGFSGATYALWRAARLITEEHCAGLVLDAGAGRGSWRGMIISHSAGYESIDISPRGRHEPTWTGDICAMPQVPDSRYDTVVCHQVLEHVRSPCRAFDEIRRVLRPEGILILSVPHLSRRHELPHDYFRFTQEGIELLLREHGFEPINVAGYGGLLSFLHHQASFFFPGLVSGVPVLGVVASVINYPMSRFVVWLDRKIDRTGLFATGVIAVARRLADGGDVVGRTEL